MSELLAPGGSFFSAIAALDNGADAVYCGLPQFSARRSAKNLSLEQLYRLREQAERRDKKIYLALNTLIQEKEWPLLIELLHKLEPLHPHGIILQDLGLLHLLKRNFPNYPLHGSTQMAIHNSAGVREAEKLGIERVVLSRECGLDVIKQIRKDCPDMELEVFIHGALCVSFSGLCFASGKLLNRSANRGECGQICRTWFSHENQKDYPFSARDLELGKDILELKKIGVHSFKIEGRMKGPEYTACTAAYYRAILDGAAEPKIEQLRQESKQAFSRESTSAWFSDPKGLQMIQKDEPGHRGIALGKLTSESKLKLDAPLAQRDGLLYLPKKYKGSLVKAHRFAARFTDLSGKRLFKGEPGQEIILDEKLSPGGELFRLSRHDQNYPVVKEESYAPFRPPGNLKIHWTENLLSLDCDLGFSKYRQEWNQALEKANKPGLKAQWKKLFSEATGGPVDIKRMDTGDLDMDQWFIPVSRLKEIRREFRAGLEQFLVTRKMDLEKREIDRQVVEALPDRELLNNRENLSPTNDKLPFLQDPEKADWKDFYNQQERTYIALKPVSMNDHYLQKLEERLKADKEKSFVLGLNNLSHLSLCKSLKNEERISFWVDYGLYCSNASAVDFFMENIPRLRAILYWIEGPEQDAHCLGLSYANNFSPPFFNSAVCYHRHSLSKGCPPGCSKHYDYELEQNGKSYTVLVRDCWSYLVSDK